MGFSVNLCAYVFRTLHGHFRSESVHVWYQMFYHCLRPLRCCGWMVNPLEASVTEQSSTRSSKSSCWISVNSLLKISWTVTNMQFRSSESRTTVHVWSHAWILEVGQTRVQLRKRSKFTSRADISCSEFLFALTRSTWEFLESIKY